MSNPWQKLTHETIIKTVEQILAVKLSNLVLKRNSYINRVYELEEHDSRQRFIVKFYRPGRWTKAMIAEEHSFLAELADKEIPVIPPLKLNNESLFMLGPIPYALFPKKGGRAIDEFDQEGWEEIGRTLARIHLVGTMHKPSKRITWRPKIATKHHLDMLLKSSFILPKFQNAFKKAAELFIKRADSAFEKQEYILIHGDCHKGNLLHRPKEGFFIVDFDDICLGPAIQDVWMLFPDEIDNCENELQWFLKGYETFRPFDLASLDLIPLLRGMRMVHFVAWQAIQHKDPDFSRHFPEAGTSRYWNELIKDLQEIVFKNSYGV